MNKKRTSEDAAAERNDLENEILPVTFKINSLIREEARLKSLEWIEENGATIENVEVPKSEYHLLCDFAEYLMRHSRRPFAEWNGKIYSRHHLITGNLPDMPGRFDDLK